MIFYFSGTGNSRWAAEQIAALTGDETRDISRLEKTPEIRNERQIGLVFPIYAWGVPEPMLDFVKTLEKTNLYVRSLHLRGGGRTGHEKALRPVSYPQQL